SDGRLLRTPWHGAVAARLPSGVSALLPAGQGHSATPGYVPGRAHGRRFAPRPEVFVARPAAAERALPDSAAKDERVSDRDCSLPPRERRMLRMRCDVRVGNDAIREELAKAIQTIQAIHCIAEAPQCHSFATL